MTGYNDWLHWHWLHSSYAHWLRHVFIFSSSRIGPERQRLGGTWSSGSCMHNKAGIVL